VRPGQLRGGQNASGIGLGAHPSDVFCDRAVEQLYGLRQIALSETGLAMRKFIVWSTMKNEFGSCSWSISDEDTYPMLTVVTHLGTKSTQLGWHPPDLLARILMKELYYERAPGHTD
jgi:hypothetical protein